MDFKEGHRKYVLLNLFYYIISKNLIKIFNKLIKLYCNL